MTMKRTIGGDRLGSGKKMTVDLKTYERSTHDMGYIWRSTMAAGTLVPFMVELGLPGDSFDIKLDCDVKTHPTVGPLFGSYKVQLDVFVCPIRLYQGQLHNNKLGIGMNMATIKLPQVEVKGKNPNRAVKDYDNQQINPSSILSYLNIRGLGVDKENEEVVRRFNAIPYLGYWDIYKQYYANKQEEIGAVIHGADKPVVQGVISVEYYNGDTDSEYLPRYPNLVNGLSVADAALATIVVEHSIDTDANDLIIWGDFGKARIDEIMIAKVAITTTTTSFEGLSNNYLDAKFYAWDYREGGTEGAPKIRTFPLSNIDLMKEDILTKAVSGSQIVINDVSIEPYSLPLVKLGADRAILGSQEGLGLKTYQSDLFNNWMSTEWIDGDNGINAITAIDTSDGSFEVTQLLLARKVYDMLNGIAISGGSYYDWLEVVYSHDPRRTTQSPIYMGGLIKELVFQEVVSNAETEVTESGEKPLGTLAGKGVMSSKNKGGYVNIKIDEPSYIIGIVSKTPRVDYSQGNKWDVNLKTMDDLHKPALDEIGFQDLITDQMAWWDTEIVDGEPVFKSAGKQPAWLNYMTNVNQVRGNFAIEDNEMFMTLNRRYEVGENGIQDMTTYIDPVKYNNIFALKARDAQNFWTQISVDITARRKMSAKIMPNL